MRSAERRGSCLFLLLAAGAIALAGFSLGRGWQPLARRSGDGSGAPAAETRTVAARGDLAADEAEPGREPELGAHRGQREEAEGDRQLGAEVPPRRPWPGSVKASGAAQSAR